MTLSAENSPRESPDRHRQPILVTGVPRSGTTWLARLLATAQGTVLAGREPMNPRGKQYGLGGSLDGWARLPELSRRQARVLRLAYAGLNPWVYSRYGRRQWAGPLPWSRVIVKDPFAMLTLPAIASTTDAIPVLLYRHPGAVFASYRRMGWEPDSAELGPIVEAFRAQRGLPAPSDSSVVTSSSPAERMGVFWRDLHEMALADVCGMPQAIVISHQDLAGGGSQAARRLFSQLQLQWSPSAEAEFSTEGAHSSVSGDQLHNFGRSPSAVAVEWRTRLDPADVEVIEQTTSTTRASLEAAKLDLAG